MESLTVDPKSDVQKFEFDLIEQVKTHQNLFNVNHEKYPLRYDKVVSWQAISKELCQPADKCRYRWSKMRGTFRKIISTHNTYGSVVWPYFSSMKFLIPFMKIPSDKVKELYGNNVPETEYFPCDDSKINEMINENAEEIENKNDIQKIFDKTLIIDGVEENLRKCAEMFTTDSGRLIIVCNECEDFFFDLINFNAHFSNNYKSCNSNIPTFETSIEIKTETEYNPDIKVEIETNKYSDTSSEEDIEKNSTKPIHNGKNICYVCGLELTHRTTRNLHVFKFHPSEYKGKTFPCQFCEKVYNQNMYLVKHLRIHTGERPYSCKICKKKFISATTLREHRTHVHIREKNYLCRINGCNESFKYWPTRRRHERIKHEGVFPFQCDICGNSYPASAELTSHKTRAHTDKKDRPHKCTLCGHAFLSTTSLKYHMNSHTGAKPYSCLECNASFAKPGALRQHKNIHSDVKKYACNICDKKFTQISGLSSHKKTHRLMDFNPD